MAQQGPPSRSRPPSRHSRRPEPAGPDVRDRDSWPGPTESQPAESRPAESRPAEGQPGEGQPPADEWAGADRGGPPGRSPRPRPSGSRRQPDPFTGDEDEDEDLPPWAGLSIHPAGPGGTRLRPPASEPGPDIPEEGQDGPGQGAERPRGRRRGRAAAARLRKSRRRVLVLCGTAIVVVLIIALVAVALHGRHKPVSHSSFINTLQAGEFRAVPKSCSTVAPAVLTQYLLGPARPTSPSGTGRAASQCTFTVDAKPVFRVLEIGLQAYQPSALAAGNGSATDNAIEVFAAARQVLAAPGKKSPLPPARVSPVSGLGTEAISAVQVTRSSQTVTDLVTVLARDHNVIITIKLQAEARGGGYGPVRIAHLQAGATAIARAVMAKVTAEPAVKA